MGEKKGKNKEEEKNGKKEKKIVPGTKSIWFCYFFSLFCPASEIVVLLFVSFVFELNGIYIVFTALLSYRGESEQESSIQYWTLQDTEAKIKSLRNKVWENKKKKKRKWFLKKIVWKQFVIEKRFMIKWGEREREREREREKQKFVGAKE